MAERQGFHILADVSNLPFQNNGAVTTKKFIREQPNTVRRYVKSQIEAVHVMKTDRRTGLKVFTKHLAGGRDADPQITEKSYEVNRRGMHQLVDGFAALGLETVPSRGNFVLVKVGAAGKVYQALLERGVIVRPVANYGLPEWLRVTIGLPEENARLLQVLPEALAAARG